MPDVTVTLQLEHAPRERWGVWCRTCNAWCGADRAPGAVGDDPFVFEWHTAQAANAAINAGIRARHPGHAVVTKIRAPMRRL